MGINGIDMGIAVLNNGIAVLNNGIGMGIAFLNNCYKRIWYRESWVQWSKIISSNVFSAVLSFESKKKA